MAAISRIALSAAARNSCSGAAVSKAYRLRLSLLPIRYSTTAVNGLVEDADDLPEPFHEYPLGFVDERARGSGETAGDGDSDKRQWDACT